MKLKLAIVALAVSASLAWGQSSLSVYHFVLNTEALGTWGAPVTPLGNIIEVFVATQNQSTAAFRLTVQYVNKDGSTGTEVGQVDRAATGYTLFSFRAAHASAVTSVHVDEEQIINSADFQ